MTTNKRRKLTDEQREEIRRRYPAEMQKDLAAEYGVSCQTISTVTNPAYYARQKARKGALQNARYICDPFFRERRIAYARERYRALRSKQASE